ncbi:MAG: hypothetical protein F6K54_28330 [Okeania sp. SIO3B5]|nr:hypothetical protein [Okeania sp. SIO3B5]
MFMLPLISALDISNNKKSNQLSHKNYQFFPSTGGARGGFPTPYSLLPTPYAWRRCLFIILPVEVLYKPRLTRLPLKTAKECQSTTRLQKTSDF